MSKIYNPFTKKNQKFKHPYTKTLFKLYKRMIKDGLGEPDDVLPKGVTYKNGRLYLAGKGTREQKLKALIRKHKTHGILRKHVEEKQAGDKEARKTWRALAKKLRAPNATFVVAKPIRRKRFGMIDVYLKLKKPTADHQKVLNMLKKYMEMFPKLSNNLKYG